LFFVFFGRIKSVDEGVYTTQKKPPPLRRRLGNWL